MSVSLFGRYFPNLLRNKSFPEKLTFLSCLTCCARVAPSITSLAYKERIKLQACIVIGL